MLKKWDNLPLYMKNEEVRPYYEILKKKQVQLFFKRVFDLILALVLLILLFLPMIVIAVWIKMDSKGPVFYRQERITAYGKPFMIHKFRTMIENAEKAGSSVTVKQDPRITNAGKRIRHLRLDELPQLLDVLKGDMSFVGTRPEASKYVREYRPEYYATLLLRAGITSEASIRFKNEDQMLSQVPDVDQAYLEGILPQKMYWNLKSIREFSLIDDFITMMKTVFAVIRKEEKRN